MDRDDQAFLESLWQRYPLKNANIDIIRRDFKEEGKLIGSPTDEEIDRFLDKKLKDRAL